MRKNAVGDPSTRKVITIENRAMEKTPILIGLAGFYGTSNSFLNRSYMSRDFPSSLERILLSKPNLPFIIALPDTMTSFRGNQYINSPAVGNYEDFIVTDLIPELISRYGKRKIGLFGKSSGGFGSYTLTVRHPEVFDGFIDVSGDAAFEYCYLKDFPKAISLLSRTSVRSFLRKMKTKPNPDNDDLLLHSLIAMSAFYSPNKKSEYGFDLPFDPETGVLNESVWEKWLKLDPARTVSRNIDALKDKTIVLQTGVKDEFAINLGMKQIHLALEREKVVHFYKAYEAGHFGIDFMYEESIPSLVRGLS